MGIATILSSCCGSEVEIKQKILKMTAILKQRLPPKSKMIHIAFIAIPGIINMCIATIVSSFYGLEVEI